MSLSILFSLFLRTNKYAQKIIIKQAKSRVSKEDR